MNSVKFIREPGYIYDLIFTFIYHFNKDRFLNDPTFKNNDKADEDRNFFNRTMYDFSDISDDLLLFFQRQDNGRCFFSQYCFNPYANSFASEYNMVFIQKLLSDITKIKNEICQCYFPEIAEDKIDFFCDSIFETGKLIDESNYSDRIKSKLYSFFVNPASVIQKLNLNLTSMNLPLSKYYEKNYQTIIDLQNQFNRDEFIENVKKIKNNPIFLSEFENIYISICLLNKNCLNCYFPGESDAMLLLGYDYKDALSYLISSQSVVELDKIGGAVADKNRIEILDYILSREEATLKDIESVFKASISNVYYHISLMSKTNILKVRNQGKKVLYSVNKEFCDAVIRHIKKYSTDPDGR